MAVCAIPVEAEMLAMEKWLFQDEPKICCVPPKAKQTVAAGSNGDGGRGSKRRFVQESSSPSKQDMAKLLAKNVANIDIRLRTIEGITQEACTLEKTDPAAMAARNAGVSYAENRDLLPPRVHHMFRYTKLF